ncbi:MAG: electron transport complex subunit RsxC [Candidatus Competibacteraceae bacterium]|nr:electron transport complex subunit RsxC [Candidatus Competibacteraceae bacterium]
MKLFDFRGGVHPPGHKHLSAERPIQIMPFPERLYLPLQQHRGKSALPVVTVGQKVLQGELLAKAQGSVSAPVHAPTSGTIIAIGDFNAPHPSGLPLPTITLEPDGEDRKLELGPLPDPFTLEPAEVARQIGDAGIVGMGGANFPSAVKLGMARKAEVHTLVLNGAECEPYMTCDDRLMRERSAAIVDGARIMLHAIQAQRAVIAIEDNKPEAAAQLQAACEAVSDQPLSVEVVVIPSRYPAGSASQLIQLLTGLEVPAEGRSTVTGLLVHNVGTAYAVHRALREGRPLISRIVTVTGGAVAEPQNLEAPIGALAEDMLRFCGVDSAAIARLLMGGPMMGQPMPNAQIPLVKGANGLLALTAAEIAGLPETTACIRCGRCASVCPMGLLPLEMAKRAHHDDPDGAMAFGLDDCMSCGSCAYACPSHIPLVQYFDYARGALAAREQADQRAETARRLMAERQARLDRQERAKLEAAARRRAEKQKSGAGTPA